MASKLVRKLEHCVRLCVSNRGSCFKKDSWALNARGAIELFRGEAERDRGQAPLDLHTNHGHPQRQVCACQKECVSYRECVPDTPEFREAAVALVKSHGLPIRKPPRRAVTRSHRRQIFLNATSLRMDQKRNGSVTLHIFRPTKDFRISQA